MKSSNDDFMIITAEATKRRSNIMKIFTNLVNQLL